MRIATWSDSSSGSTSTARGFDARRADIERGPIPVRSTNTAGGAGHPGSLVVAVVAASGWGLGSVLAGHLPLRRRTPLGAAMQLTIGDLVLLVIGAARGEWGQFDLAAVPADAYLAFAWLVVPGSILAFSAYAYALSHLPLGVVSTYAYVNPVVAVLLGVALLGESLGRNEVIGAILIVVAVVVSLLRGRPAPPGAIERGNR